MLKFRVLLFAGLLISLCTALQAQDSKEYFIRQPLSLRFSYQLLHSTHQNNFTGGSFDVNVDMTKHLMLGAGVQYAGRHLHYDNGWTLTHLRFFPVYLNTIYAFCPARRFQPYLHTEEGISFNHYNKLDTTVLPTPYPVSEPGLYLSGNLGTNIIFLNHLKAFTELGYKGFKHSTNELDVNPHGVTGRLGIDIY